jgi:hypothetical protein
MPQVNFSQSDIESLASKLDELGAVLTEKERGLLTAVFGLAATAFSGAASEAESGGVSLQPVAAFTDAKVSLPSRLPRLSDSLRGAFTPGAGGKFTIRNGGLNESVAVGGTTVTWSN